MRQTFCVAVVVLMLLVSPASGQGPGYKLLSILYDSWGALLAGDRDTWLYSSPDGLGSSSRIGDTGFHSSPNGVSKSWSTGRSTRLYSSPDGQSIHSRDRGDTWLHSSADGLGTSTRVGNTWIHSVPGRLSVSWRVGTNAWLYESPDGAWVFSP